MKILFLTPYPSEGPSYRYRVEQYLPYLENNGIYCTVSPFMDSKFYKLLSSPKKWSRKLLYFLYAVIKRIISIFKAVNYDIIFIHLEAFPLGPPLLEWIMARLMRKPIIYDFEDAIYLKRKTSWFMNFIKRPWKFYDILRLSAHVIACNQFMKELVNKYNRNVTVISTSINIDKFTVKKDFSGINELTIGWIGTPSTLTYLLDISGPLQRVAEKHRFKLKIVGGGVTVNIPGIEIINERWTLENDIQSFQSLDIGLYPLPNDERAKAKTPFKTIQYMSVGIPVVVSRAGSVENIVQDGENGFLADSKKDWEEKLLVLLEDVKLRERIGARGRETVEKYYSLSVSAPRFVKVIENVHRRCGH